jgi:hypothetical protein
MQRQIPACIDPKLVVSHPNPILAARNVHTVTISNDQVGNKIYHLEPICELH